MKELLENLAGIMNAARDNQYGLLALAALVVAVVVVLLLRGAPLWAQIEELKGRDPFIDIQWPSRVLKKAR